MSEPLKMAERLGELSGRADRVGDNAIAAVAREAAALIRRLAAENEALRTREAKLVEALTDCVDTLALVERPAFVDPVYGDEVKRLGDRIGYGALMSSASASWREAARSRGTPEGGEFVAGPCFATVVSTLRRARAAIEETGRE